ncbi:hypothetical protein ACM66B_002567 [Microbotryomycetes sp. NB124-2]
MMQSPQQHQAPVAMARRGSISTTVREFGYEQASKIHQLYPWCHVIALPWGSAKEWSMQLCGVRGPDDKLSNDRTVHTSATIQTDDGPTTFELIVFESGRVSIEAGEQVMAFASSSWEKHGSYLFFNHIAPY